MSKENRDIDMNASIETVILNNVEVQQNGIIRNSKGRLIGRLVISVDYEGEHIKKLDDGVGIEKLLRELRKDKTEGSYYYSWQANIAVAMQDAYRDAEDKSDIHKISNEGAKRFLDLLIR